MLKKKVRRETSLDSFEFLQNLYVLCIFVSNINLWRKYSSNILKNTERREEGK